MLSAHTLPVTDAIVTDTLRIYMCTAVPYFSCAVFGLEIQIHVDDTVHCAWDDAKAS